jgi:hypothetical protein
MFQYRMALFTTAAGLAGNARHHFPLLGFLPVYLGAFSGLLAYGIGFMDGAGGLRGWSWIFVGLHCDPASEG